MTVVLIFSSKSQKVIIDKLNYFFKVLTSTYTKFIWYSP